jgi:hypothetical protein
MTPIVISITLASWTGRQSGERRSSRCAGRSLSASRQGLNAGRGCGGSGSSAPAKSVAKAFWDDRYVAEGVDCR